MVEILPLGGMNEIGKNMTAIGFEEEYVIVDMGIRLDSILAFEDAEIGKMSKRELVNINAIPDDSVLRDKKIRAIILSHGHLDHIGAVGKLAAAYDVPIYGTPFTIEIVRQLIREESGPVPEEGMLRRVMLGTSLRVGEITVEFIPITHSIPQTAAILLEKKEESVLVASDFKLDEVPLLGRKIDIRRLDELGKSGLLVAMVGTVRLDEDGPTPPEARARELLAKAMRDAGEGKGLVFVTTFSSHMARLKSIVEISFEIGRTPVLVGRSLRNYSAAALALDLVNFPSGLRIHGRPNAARKVLREIGNSRSDYVLVCTGHQGEPTSVLTRIADRKLPLQIREGDEVIFSASVIPNPINQSNRAILETKLEAQGARIHRDVHVSGHAGRADTREFVKLVNPEHVVPCHGTPERLRAMSELARDMGYPVERIHLIGNGASLMVGG
jgi:ribonuclease J